MLYLNWIIGGCIFLHFVLVFILFEDQIELDMGRASFVSIKTDLLSLHCEWWCVWYILSNVQFAQMVICQQ